METVSQEQSEVSIVVKEIMSLRRERRELLASLTPGLSIWKKRRGPGSENTTLLSRFAGKDYTASAPSHVQEEMDTEPASTQEQLGRYFDSVLQDTEDLSHRMLSAAYLVVRPDGAAAALSSYVADELASSTSGLMDACKDLYKDTQDNEQAEEEVQEKDAFLDLYHEFLRRPMDYQNELALVVTKEEVEDHEKEVQKERKRVRKVNKENAAKFKQWEQKQKEMEKHDKKRLKALEKLEKQRQKAREKLLKEYPLLDHDEDEDEDEDEDQGLDLDQDQEKEKDNLDPDSMGYLKKGMEINQKFFADGRDSFTWGSKSTRCGDFRDISTLSPMHFTHYTMDTITSSCGVTGSTLQIYSIEILELKKGLKWPLKLYGVVTARDTVDRNRNILFSRVLYV
ncbi:hypothetical protein QYE76_061295 [Lolium multiflorum]|uniref:DUF6598 domain-containing protein n=1 Tax=Lolium multiflorum TaxID=4521 RepID=A0AAD8W671_LOLMU|nr:hypothetical protein QYE76_061295 [Lolium multiflorum]